MREIILGRVLGARKVEKDWCRVSVQLLLNAVCAVLTLSSKVRFLPL
jgi:hypothetical protein